jgi:hypothetical protein
MSLKNVEAVKITGNTFACKDAIKKLGGRWDAAEKCWIVDIANHPMNTMRGRSALDSELRTIAGQGCKVEYAR